MAKALPTEEQPAFPLSLDACCEPSSDDPITIGMDAVRESGRRPADVRHPAGRRACWRHDKVAECGATLRRIATDEQARRDAAIGVETLLWLHAKETLRRVPHRRFLARFDRSGRWKMGSPIFGLARGAAFYHLRERDGRTLAERFEGSRYDERLCQAEREWLAAEKTARISFFWVSNVGKSTFCLNDSFPEPGAKSAITLPYGEIAEDDIAPCQTVFARIVTWRGQPFVDLLEYDTTVRTRLADPTSPVRLLCETGVDVRDPEAFVRALFDAWERTIGPFPVWGH